MSAQAAAPYPLTLSVDYPERELNRVTTGFRLILAIPLLLLLQHVRHDDRERPGSG